MINIQAIMEHSLKILIADDDRNIRRVLQLLLMNEGFVPVLAEDGTQALELLHSKDGPQIGVIDWMMPGLDGPSVCRRVRAAQKQDDYKYLLLLTARRAQDDIISGMEAGADDYVAKPFDEAELRVRLRAGKRIVDLHNQLVQRNDTLKDFVYALSHDMRTPLLALDLTMNQAQSGTFGKLPPEYIEVLLKSRCTVKELSNMTNTLLGVGRLENGAEKLDRSNVNLLQIIEACTSELEPLWVDKKQSVTLQCDLKQITVYADQQMLRRTILNLLDNAVKFTPTGGAIGITLVGQDQFIDVIIQDGGEGVKAEDQPFLFERFAVRRNRHKGVGAGLGLYLCRRIAEEHGGSIRYENESGSASKFILQLPFLHCS